MKTPIKANFVPHHRHSPSTSRFWSASRFASEKTATQETHAGPQPRSSTATTRVIPSATFQDSPTVQHASAESPSSTSSNSFLGSQLLGPWSHCEHRQGWRSCARFSNPAVQSFSGCHTSRCCRITPEDHFTTSSPLPSFAAAAPRRTDVTHFTVQRTIPKLRSSPRASNKGSRLCHRSIYEQLPRLILEP